MLQRVMFTRMEQPLMLVLSSPSPMNGAFRDMGFPAGNPAQPSYAAALVSEICRLDPATQDAMFKASHTNLAKS